MSELPGEVWWISTAIALGPTCKSDVGSVWLYQVFSFALAAVVCQVTIAGAAGSDHFRWQALCQALALDTATGFETLAAIAGDTADALAAPAGALRASLIERHPSLARWSRPCRA